MWQEQCLGLRFHLTSQLSPDKAIRIRGRGPSGRPRKAEDRSDATGWEHHLQGQESRYASVEHSGSLPLRLPWLALEINVLGSAMQIGGPATAHQERYRPIPAHPSCRSLDLGTSTSDDEVRVEEK